MRRLALFSVTYRSWPPHFAEMGGRVLKKSRVFPKAPAQVLKTRARHQVFEKEKERNEVSRCFEKRAVRAEITRHALPIHEKKVD
jgi:hypothetical protein